MCNGIQVVEGVSKGVTAVRKVRDFRGRAEEGTAWTNVSYRTQVCPKLVGSGVGVGATRFVETPANWGRQIPLKKPATPHRSACPKLFRALRAAIPNLQSICMRGKMCGPAFED
jgi:hypothetical protein